MKSCNFLTTYIVFDLEGITVSLINELLGSDPLKYDLILLLILNTTTIYSTLDIYF